MKKICQRCGDRFSSPYRNSRYCGEEKTLQCPECPIEFTSICQRKMGICCSISCSRRRMPRENYSVALIRRCTLCGEAFTATSSRQIICLQEHSAPCAMCGESFPMNHSNLGKGRGLYCDNICSSLGQMGSTLAPGLIPQYKDIDGWARTFHESQGRKPTRHDFNECFGVNLPRTRHTPELFNLGRSSGWESKVQRYLEQRHPHLVLTPHHRQRLGSGRIMEIDLYIPSLHLGFEVQDEKTHSLDRDDEPSPFGGFKHGPTYHLEKRDGYAVLGITVVEIWQKNIEDGSYKNIVDSSLDRAESPAFLGRIEG